MARASLQRGTGGVRESYTFFDARRPVFAEGRTMEPTGDGAPQAAPPKPQPAAWRRTSQPTPSRASRPLVPLAILRQFDTAAPLLSLIGALVLTNLGRMP